MAQPNKARDSVRHLSSPAISKTSTEKTIDMKVSRAPQAAQPAGVPSTAGRRGKRSDPAFSPTTFFVRKETKKQAVRMLLDDVHDGKDLSDLVEELLQGWVRKHSHA